MLCHRMMLALSKYRLFITQMGWQAPSMGVAGDVFGEE
jgi:hypothetical protein